MLYQRQKEILYIISKVGKVGKTQLQKLTFLANINKEKAYYDFFPYNYGPFSLVLRNDLEALCKDELLSFNNDNYQKPVLDLSSLSEARKTHIDNIINQFGNCSATDLMKFVYTRYPDYAINSRKADDLLSPVQRAKLKQKQLAKESPVLFTIGYEHKSIDKYLNQLAENNIKLLVDVRAFNFSMKKEFIGSKLASSCKLLKIEYLHLPKLGIPTQFRKEITDKKILFQLYRDMMLPQHKELILKVNDLMKKYKRIALTCFEADDKDCHRSVLADEIAFYSTDSYVVEHI